MSQQVFRTLKGAFGPLPTQRTAVRYVSSPTSAQAQRSKAASIQGAQPAITNASIAHTRKTTPGFRAFELQAVQAGGGALHRFGLDDAILIKDNHVAVCGGVADAVKAARTSAGHMTRIAVEVDRLDQLDAAISAGAESVLLDNFSIADLTTAVAATKGKVTLEASGGINLDTVRGIAETGVDVISIGALTHSAPNFDIGLDEA